MVNGWIGEQKTITRETIAKVEQKWGIQFPDDYVECAMQNQGRSPDPDVFEIEGEADAINFLLGYEPERSIFILDNYNWINDRLVEKVFPFADDPFGNMVCFDYREGPVPTVVFWDHEIAFDDPEGALKPICNTFTDLLNMLREADED